MKSHQQTRIAVITLFAVLAMPLGLAAQDDAADAKKAQHHHYKLIDLGTFGGPASYYANGFDGILNRHRTSAGWADTSAADPFSVSNPAFCFNFDCFVSQAFLSRNGVITDLGSLAPGWSSAATWVNDAGQIVGLSENGQPDPVSGFPEFRAVLW